MDSPQNSLSTLNDDCLFEIIKLDCIDINDLIEVASTCTHLQSIAQEVFSIKYKKINHCDEMKEWPFEKVENYLRHFGENVDTFSTKSLKKPVAVLRSVVKYCKNLVHLRCIGSYKFDTNLLKGLCAQLKTFEYNGGIFHGGDLFEENAPLQKLRLINCDAQLPKVTLPHLTELKLTMFNRDTITDFCSQNPQIVHFRTRHILANMNVALELLDNLEEFSFLNFDFSRVLNGLKNLNRLKKLRLGYYSDDIFQALAVLYRISAPLESLAVHHCNGLSTAVINKICQFKAIKHLRMKRQGFSDGPDCDELMVILRNLRQLKTIYCDLMLFDVAEAHKLLFENSSRLRSAIFTMDRFDHEEEYWKVVAISELAKAKNFDIEIEMMDIDKSVSDKA